MTVLDTQTGSRRRLDNFFLYYALNVARDGHPRWAWSPLLVNGSSRRVAPQGKHSLKKPACFTCFKELSMCTVQQSSSHSFEQELERQMTQYEWQKFTCHRPSPRPLLRTVLNKESLSHLQLWGHNFVHHHPWHWIFKPLTPPASWTVMSVILNIQPKVSFLFHPLKLSWQLQHSVSSLHYGSQVTNNHSVIKIISLRACSRKISPKHVHTSTTTCHSSIVIHPRPHNSKLPWISSNCANLWTDKVLKHGTSGWFTNKLLQIRFPQNIQKLNLPTILVLWWLNPSLAYTLLRFSENSPQVIVEWAQVLLQPPLRWYMDITWSIFPLNSVVLHLHPMLFWCSPNLLREQHP